jgi:type III restriction enzyme
MPDTLIDNPIINSPFAEPQRHFRFDATGITNEIVASRRVSSYFMPIAQTRKRSPQLAFATEWTQDCIEENREINRIRERVGLWRKGGYPGVTPMTRRLLEYWQHPERDKRLFFTECARKFGDAWATLYITRSTPFDPPATGKFAVKVINHYGDDVLKVF